MSKEEFVEMIESMPLSKGFVQSVAISEGFQARKSAISPIDFLYSICSLSIEGTASFNDMSARLDAQQKPVSVSRQAMAQKMSKESCAKFIKKLLALIIACKIGALETGRLRRTRRFLRILVQDSTIIKLPARLFAYFSGVSNGCSSVCNARVQCVYDLLSESFISFEIDPYSINDLTAAPRLELQQGDLILRDRGYLSSGEIHRHKLSEADCIFRHKQDITYLDPVTADKVDLLGLLRKFGQLDITVALNDKKRTLVRIVAVPVSEEVANIRKMRAKKENKKAPDANYLEMLQWSVFITTIDQQRADYNFICKVYSLRWRIEIIFKSWKSSMAFSKIHTVSKNQLSIILYARFIMILICTQYIFAPAKKIVAEKLKKGLSMLKVIRYLMKNPAKIERLMTALKQNKDNLNFELRSLARYCSYEKRKRSNFEHELNTVIWA